MIPFILSAVYAAGLGNVLYFALQQAYEIRMHSIHEYGRVIHEFDPYFNYRATEYLWQHGWYEFRTWFDYMSWYPLGRPVGTTIYPGMQVSSVLIKQFILPTWSINDICCFVPAWFGVLATAMTALLAYECMVGTYGRASGSTSSTGTGSGTTSTGSASNSTQNTSTKNTKNAPQEFQTILNDIPIVKQLYQAIVVPLVREILQLLQKYTGSTWGLVPSTSSTTTNTLWSTPALESALVAAVIMSMVPAHLMRSVAGGYDNESIAMFAMTSTFYCWCRSLRGTTPNICWSITAAVAYFYMVAAWGGYVFVLNLVGVHATVLVLLGRYSTKLHRAYTIFYGVGTLLAIQVPVVGWTPLKSMEQIGPLLAFLAFQIIEFVEMQKRRRRLSWKQAWLLRLQVFGGAALLALCLAAILVNAGYFGPISSRVRGLFVKHTKTGNPLVDSVAEHQPANAGAYFQYLDVLVYLCPVGLGLVGLQYFHDASSFLVVYGVAAYYFSAKMVRLILLTAPIASVLSGIAIAHLWAWGMTALLGQRPSLMALFGNFGGDGADTATDVVVEVKAVVASKNKESSKNNQTGKRNKKQNKNDNNDDDDDAALLLAASTQEKADAAAAAAATTPIPEAIPVRVIRFALFVAALFYMKDSAQGFYEKCHELSHHMSHPTIIQKGRTRNGEEVIIDDYREAYWWLRDNTPQDARVMAWWDYGYQIAGIANRTTIADGNTWNHEHIALLGRALTSPLKDGHRIARHLADYILIWTGGGGDDVAKSPHMRRIANSVYRFLCPNDPTCRAFGVDQTGQPTPDMRASLLYQLHSHQLQAGIEADKNRFKLVYQTERGKVRIFKILSVSKESKAWVRDPANMLCDAPGSWFCPGQYPPALQKILSEKKDFAQLEDFNKKKAAGEKDDSEYTKKYLENLNNPEAAARAAKDAERSGSGKKGKKSNKPSIVHLHKEDIAMMNNPEAWDDNMMTTAVWEVINANDIRGYRDMLIENPELAHIRSKDGRGPMWWAHEYGRTDFVKMLKKVGVAEDLMDVKGVTPLSLSTVKEEL